jgi:2-polyprenyl-3-methyl-5-hydroxy-6-metoxy-1,4-benzoquinol methylase
MDLSIKPEEYFSSGRPEMMVYLPEHAKRILEIGCGEGNFAAFLKKKLGAEVWGVELEDIQANVAKTKLDNVLTGDISVLLDRLPEQYFDVIVANDVLEHLIDPYTVLAKLRRNLSPTGIIVCSIPNIRFFRTLYDFVFNKNWDYTDNGIMDKTHYRFFTIKSIPKMFENAGYQIIKMEGINATKSIRPLLWNILFLGYFRDIKFLQFAVVAKSRL